MILKNGTGQASLKKEAIGNVNVNVEMRLLHLDNV